MSTILNILLVEDDPINQKVASCIVKRENHNITIAENGEVGVEKYLNEKYDLILMDIQMPVMDGIEATKKIREIEMVSGQHTPIIAVTAYASSYDETEAFEAGCDDYISKPLDSDVLWEKLSKFGISTNKKG